MRDYSEMTIEELSQLAGYPIEDTDEARAQAILYLQQQDVETQQEKRELQQDTTEIQYDRLLNQYDRTLDAIEDSSVLTEEQIQKNKLDLEALKGTGQITGFGSVEELGVPKTSTTPLQEPSVYDSVYDIFYDTILKRTTGTSPTVQELDDPSTQNLRSTFAKELRRVSTDMDPAEQRGFIAGGLKIFNDVVAENQDLSLQEQYDLAIDALIEIERAPDITTEQATAIDPEYSAQPKADMTGLEITAEALDVQKYPGTDLPVYNQQQFDYFNTVQNSKYQPEISAQATALANAQTREERFVNFLEFNMGDGIYLSVPTETIEYIYENPLGGNVYDPETDLQLKRMYEEREFSVSPTLLDINTNTNARLGLARARAYKTLGNPDWKQSQEKRRVVLENIREFDAKGWVQDETAIGGTSDSTALWLFKAITSPMTAFSAAAYEGLDEATGALIGLGFEAAEAAGLVGEADYIGEAGFTEVREKALTPKYQGYGLAGRVAENIALSKGFTGEAEVVADSLNLDTAYNPSAAAGMAPYIVAGLDTTIRAGGALMDVSIDPVGDAMIAAPKALSAGYKTYKAHKAIHGASSVADSLKAIAKTGGAEIDLLQGSLSLANQYDTRIPKGITPDDLSVTMADNVADNLLAARAIETNNLDDIAVNKLDQTNVVKSNNPESFYSEIKKNPATNELLEEYRQTDELLNVMKGADDPTQKALTFAKRKSDLPKANVEQAKRALKAADEGLGNPGRNLSRIYGRNIFYAIAPEMPSLENLQWLTRKTLATKGKRDELIAIAANTPSMKTMYKVVEHNGEVRERVARVGRSTGYDVFNQNVNVKPTETVDAYSISGMEQSEIDSIIEVIEGLELPTTLKQEIVSNIQDEGILFVDDYNAIESAIRDRVARVSSGGASIEDINRLEMEAQQRMLEASGTVYRDKSVVDKLSAGGRYFIQKVLDSTMGRRAQGFVNPKTIDKAFKKLGTPVVNNLKTTGVQLRRVLQEHNKSMATLGFRTQTRFKDLMEGNAEQITRYIDAQQVPDQLTASQTIGLMTVGERPKITDKFYGVARAEQKNNLVTSMRWMLDNLFVRKQNKFPLTYSQLNASSGLLEATTPTIWNNNGIEYINQQLDILATKIIDNPLEYWNELQEFMVDLNDAIQNPLNRNRSYTVTTENGVETIDAPIVNTNVTSENVNSLDRLQLENRFGLIALSTYYVAESNRIMAKVLSDSLRKDFKSLSVADITDVPIAQDTFETSVQEAAKIIYNNNNIKESEQAVFDKFKNVVAQAHKAEVASTLDTTINIKRLDDEILRELRTVQSEFNKDVSLEYKAASKNMTDRIKLELEVIREENADKLKIALKKFDRDKESAIRIDQRELDEKLTRDIEKIPEDKRKNPVLSEIRKDRTRKLKQVSDKQLALKKQITKRLQKKKITKIEAEQARAKVDAKAKQQKAKVRKQAEEKIDAEKAKYEKYAEDSDQVRKLKLEHAKAKNDLNKPYVKPRKNLRDKLVNEMNNDMQVRKQQLFAERQNILDNIQDAKSDKGDISKAQEDLAALETIEEKIEYLKENVTVYNPEFDKILQQIKSAKLSEEDLTDVAEQVQNYAQTVLRNNGHNYKLSRGRYQDIEDSIDTLFNQNEGFARAMFGDDTFNQLKNELVTKTRAQRQRIIVEALNNDLSVVDMFGPVIDMMNEAFYISVLGLNVGSHVRNTVSAPAIVYQTTGKLLNRELVKSGENVVKHGKRIGSKYYGKIVVRTPGGVTYTNADLFNILQESGVKSQFQFLQSEMSRKGKLIRELDALKDRNLSDWSYSWLKRVGRAPFDALKATVEVQTYEDMTFRAAVLIDALNEGRSVEEAAALARRSMFDYTDIDEGLNKWLRAAFVFSSFRIQNFKEFYRSLSSASKFGRYLKILNATRTTNALFRSMNDKKQLPYQMYYPQFAQTRIVWEINNYNDRVAFAMAPSIPAIDSMTDMIGFISLLTSPMDNLEAKDVDPKEMVTRQLMPIIQEIVSTSGKYESSKAKPAVVNLLKSFSGANTPSEVAEMLERFAGGRVKITLAEPGDKNAVDGYIYTLSAEQRKKLYHGSFWTALTVLGGSNLVVNYFRLTDPEGTTWQSLDGFQRSLAYLGLYSVSEAKNVEVQQTQRMRGIISQMKRIENTTLNLEEELD